MPFLEELIKWSNKSCPKWMSDAIRRLYEGDITNEDENEIYELLKAEYGLHTKSTVVVKPFAPDLTTTMDSCISSIRLASLHSTKNVNRIKDGEHLRFQKDGLTVIYGDNASGKSGYARIFKRACHARHSGNKILPNLFKYPESSSITAESTFEISLSDGRQKSIGWKDDGRIVDELSQIAIFDKDCARVLVDKENEVEFLPYGADVLISLAELCDRLKDNLSDEIQELPSIPQPLLDLEEDSEVKKRLDKLTANSKPDELKKFATLSSEERKLFDKIKRAILGRKLHDAKTLAEKCVLFAHRLQNLETQLNKINNQLNNDSCKNLSVIINKTFASEKAAKKVTSIEFSKEPLKGTGSETWRLMYDAAKAFAEQEAYPGRVYADTFEDYCVLCQQPIRDDATERMRRFEVFVQDKIVSDAQRYRAELEARKMSIKDLNLEPFHDLEEFSTEFEQKYPKEFKTICEYLKNAKVRQIEILGWFKSKDHKVTKSLPDLSVIFGFLKEKKGEYIELAKAYMTQTPTKEQIEEEKKSKQLQERLLLKDNFEGVKIYIESLKVKQKLQACITSCHTKKITDQQDKLLKEVVSDKLKKSLEDELLDLGLTSIKPTLQTKPVKGHIYHRIVLDGLVAAEVRPTGVLSEGEDLVLAIACFLAELSMTPWCSVVVFDDPVCSLDHLWRTNVALRFIKLSKDHQVIIFTHDIVFLVELQECAKSEGLESKFLLHAIQNLGGLSGIVLPELDHPFEMQKVEKRIGRLNRDLQNLRAIHKKEGNSESYRKSVRDIYSLLRSAWERTIEEVLFGNVVLRFRKSINTLQLKDVATNIKKEDCEQIEKAMTKCSEITDAHDTAGAARGKIPEPTEIENDIKNLNLFVDDIQSRKKKVSVKSPVA